MGATAGRTSSGDRRRRQYLWTGGCGCHCRLLADRRTGDHLDHLAQARRNAACRKNRIPYHTTPKPSITPANKQQGNLLNRHSHKYSGLANSKVVSIHPSAEGSQITIAKIKADAKPNQVNFGAVYVVSEYGWRMCGGACRRICDEERLRCRRGNRGRKVGMMDVRMGREGSRLEMDTPIPAKRIFAQKERARSRDIWTRRGTSGCAGSRTGRWRKNRWRRAQHGAGD
jgi:hypothetical protein